MLDRTFRTGTNMPCALGARHIQAPFVFLTFGFCRHLDLVPFLGLLAKIQTRGYVFEESTSVRGL